jgi:hypothetical protein
MATADVLESVRRAGAMLKAETQYACAFPQRMETSGALSSSYWKIDANLSGLTFDMAWDLAEVGNPSSGPGRIVYSNAAKPDGDNSSLILVQTDRPDLNASYYWTVSPQTCSKQTFSPGVLVALQGTTGPWEPNPLQGMGNEHLSLTYTYAFSSDIQARFLTFPTDSPSPDVDACMPIGLFVVDETKGVTNSQQYVYANMTRDPDFEPGTFEIPPWCPQ